MALSAEAEAVRVLMAAGVPGKLVERAIRTITVEEHDDGDSLAAKVAAVKTDLPGLFDAAVTPAPYSNTRTAPTGPAMSMDDAAKEAREKYPHLVPQLPDSAA